MRTTVGLLLALCAMGAATADVIAVIGTGKVGSALGTEFAAQGHTIVYGSRDPTSESVRELVQRTGNGATATFQSNAVRNADIVILAVPGMLAGDITAGLGDLSGKIIVDPTNPINFTNDGIRHGVDTSNGEIIQAAAPDAHVVKAFNVLSWQYMIDPDASGGPISIPLAVKVGPYFSSMGNFANRLVSAGADGLVLFNRFYQPDIDLETLSVEPNLVLEIAFDSIQPSKRHDSGLSLRFPRIKAIRRDKGPDDIDTLRSARALLG